MRSVALTSTFPAKSDSAPPGHAELAARQRTSLTFTTTCTFSGEAVKTRSLTWLTDEAARPFASGEPTVRTPESSVGGLQEPVAKGAPCKLFGARHSPNAGTRPKVAGEPPFGRG